VRNTSRHLEALPFLTQQAAARHAAILQAQARHRMRRHGVDALGDVEAGRGGIEDEGRDAVGRLRPAAPRTPRACAAAREQDVEVGAAAVRDPGLFAVQHPVVASAPRGAAQGRHVRPGVRLGQCEGGDRLAARHPRQPGALLFFIAEQGNGAAAQALHREGEVGQRGVARQRLAHQAQGAGVDRLAGAAIGHAGHRVAQPVVAPQPLDQRAADGVDIGALRRGAGIVQVGRGPAIEGACQFRVVRVEERPVQIVVFHHSSRFLRRPGRARYARLSYLCNRSRCQVTKHEIG